MMLQRKEAITLSSFLKFLSFDPDERKIKIENALAEISQEITDVTPETANYHARKYIENKFSYFTNSYLQAFLTNQLAQSITVKGDGPKLIACLCCGYKTLEGIGWEICPVCFWEDDIRELHKISGANQMTLSEAKGNFKQLGVMSEGVQKYLDPDRMIQYDKAE